MAGEEKRCDIDDLLCQMQTLNLLQGMESLIGTEKFQNRYPEFKGLGKTIQIHIGTPHTSVLNIPFTSPK